jgi:predicted dehydrogenase
MHLPALRRLKGAVLVGGCDTDPERLPGWERETHTRAYRSLAELLQGGRPEVVIVATPPQSHAELAIAALEAGAHVYCEKPFTDAVGEADRVLAAAEAAGRRVALNHHMRETPILKALRERIGSKQDGRLVFCQIVQLTDVHPSGDQRAWRAAMPHRTLFEGGVHLVDLMLYLHGATPVAVSACRSSGLDGGDADPIHLVTFEYPRGALGHVTMHGLCRAGHRYLEVRADCERASLRASIGGRALLRVGKKRAQRAGLRLDLSRGGSAWMEQGIRRRTLARNPRPADVHGSIALFERSLACFERDEEPPASGREARDGLAVIDAAYLSAKTGNRIEL